MSDYIMTFYDPIRPGDRITSGQMPRSVSDAKTARVGTGRFWVIDVEYRNQHGELVGVETLDRLRLPQADQAQPTARATTRSRAARRGPRGRRAAAAHLRRHRHHRRARRLGGRDWRPMHHDHQFAVERNGVRDIFLNTTGPGRRSSSASSPTGPGRPGRLGRLGFKMRSPMFPDETMVITRHGHRRSRRRHRLRLGRARLRAQRRRRGPRHRRRPRRHPDHSRRQPLGPPRRALAALNAGEDTHMDLDFTPEQEMLREAVAGVCAPARGPRRRAPMENDPIGYSGQVLGAARRARPARDDAARGVRRQRR